MNENKELKFDNPPSRLHAMLVAYLSYPAQKNVGANQERLSRFSVWSRVLDIDESEKNTVVRGILAVEELGLGIIKEAKAMGIDQDLYTGQLQTHLPNITNIINLAAPTDGGKNIPDTLLHELRFCAEKFEDYSTLSPAYHSDEVKGLIAVADKLISSISSSELPPELKVAMLRNANGIRESLLLFNVTGYDGLKESLHAIAGMMVLRDEELKVAVESDTNNLEIMKTLAGLANKVDSFAAFCDKNYKRYQTLRHPIKAFIKFVDDQDTDTPDTAVVIEPELESEES